MQEILGLVFGLSIATERLVEITRNFIPPLNKKYSNSYQENFRKGGLQIHAAIAGISVAYLSQPMIADSLPAGWDETSSIVVVGLLASGGSGFWNKFLKLFGDLTKFQKTGIAAVLSQPRT